MNESVSVIVPFFNSASTILPCLDSILSSECAGIDEIICVDDGSGDGSAALVAGRAALDVRIRLVRQDNRGPAAARNRGAVIAKGDVIFFVDADVRLSAYTLTILVRRLQIDGFSCAVPLVLPIKKGNIIEEFEVERHKKVFGTDSRVVKLAPTYAFLIKKDIFNKVGRFDEKFKYPAAEDYDLSARITDMGYSIFHSVDAVVYHDHATDMHLLLRRAFLYGREGVKFSIKHKRLYIEIFFLFAGILAPFKALMRRSVRMGIVGFCFSATMAAGRLCGFLRYGLEALPWVKYE